MTYDELIQIVEDEIIDLDSSWDVNKPLLLERAQLRIQRALDLNADRIEEVFTVSESEVYLPDDLIILRHLRIVDGDYLLFKDISFLRTYWPDPAERDTPKYYGYVNDCVILVAPTPSRDDLEIAYTVRLPVLGPDVPVNWLSEYAPELMQYSLLYEMAIWTKDPEMQGVYRNSFIEALNNTAGEYNLRKRTDEYRRGEPTVGQQQR